MYILGQGEIWLLLYSALLSVDSALRMGVDWTQVERDCWGGASEGGSLGALLGRCQKGSVTLHFCYPLSFSIQRG